MNIQEASQTIPGRLVTTEHPDNTVPRKNKQSHVKTTQPDTTATREKSALLITARNSADHPAIHFVMAQPILSGYRRMSAELQQNNRVIAAY